MRIEILFPELCNLYGDLANMRYLRRCLPQAVFIETPLSETPRFLSEPMSLVYMGPMSERTQQLVIRRLLPHKEKLRACIDSGMVFLFTGNALEVLGSRIQPQEGPSLPGLGLFDLWARQNLYERHNSACEALFMEERIMGFKSQFTMCYPGTGVRPLFQVTRGMGMNLQSKEEGVRDHNFLGTYLLGPLLLLNPGFTKYLLGLMGVEAPALAFEDAMYDAYQKRLADFSRNVRIEPPKYKYM